MQVCVAKEESYSFTVGDLQSALGRSFDVRMNGRSGHETQLNFVILYKAVHPIRPCVYSVRMLQGGKKELICETPAIMHFSS